MWMSLKSYIGKYSRNTFISDQLDAIDKEIAELKVNGKMIFDNSLILDCDHKTLKLWEKYLALKKYEGTDEERAERIIYFKNLKETFTVKKCEDMAFRTTGSKAIVLERPSQFMFFLVFAETNGIPRNLETFIEELQIHKPAHLLYEFKFPTRYEATDLGIGTARNTYRNLKFMEMVKNG